jgi:hypothetical protein
MKSRRMRWAKNVERVEEIENSHKILLLKPQGKTPPAVYPENQMKPTDTFCGQNAELLIIKAGGTYS